MLNKIHIIKENHKGPRLNWKITFFAEEVRDKIKSWNKKLDSFGKLLNVYSFSYAPFFYISFCEFSLVLWLWFPVIKQVKGSLTMPRFHFSLRIIPFLQTSLKRDEGDIACRSHTSGRRGPHFYSIYIARFIRFMRYTNQWLYYFKGTFLRIFITSQ